ncbi:hypothetical protein WJX72_008857 [[Myrmecia] bisecta]|uniref:protein-tyrosine sulfotransferase n=1 Tax=[Myrmecia] bisecta TaxID=41462 RepID=A0AAW1PM94_9CHLO
MSKRLLFDPFAILAISLTFLALCAHGSEVQQMEAQAQQLRELLKQSPDQADLHLQLATLLHQLDHLNPNGGQRIPEAEASYRAALANVPTEELKAGILGNLGALLMGAGRLDDCLAATEQSLQAFRAHHLEQSPLYAGALFNKGKALGMLGKAEQAQQAYLDAIQAARGATPDTFAKAYASLKTFTEDQLSDLENAVAFLALATGEVEDSDPPGVGSRRKRRSRGSRRARLAADWGWLEGMAPADHSWLRFALFHAYEEAKQYEKAWEELAAANRLQHQTEQANNRRDELLLGVIQQVFQPPNPGAPGPYEALLKGYWGHDSEVPIFVVGMPRSGSTLVEQILASHSQVWGAGEDTRFAPLIPDIIRALDTTTSPGYKRLAELGRQYTTEMQARVPKSQAATRIVDKMLRNAWNVGYIAITLRKACIIHVVRHPMDVTLSCYAQPFEGRGTPWAWDLEDIAAQIELTHKVMAHWDAVLPGRVLRVAYEELVSNQEAASRRMLDFCHLAWEPRVLDFHNLSRPVQTASLAQVRQKIYMSGVGKWRRYEKQLQPTYERLKPLTEQYEQLMSGGRLHVGKDEL